MRKIVNSTYISLDGVIENPQNWTMDYFGEEAQGFAREQLFASDALLMGRATYDGFAQAWPAMEEQTGDFGARMNNLPHYVVSDSLEKGEWNNTVIIRRADAVAEIAKLKEQDGQDILQYGFGPVSRTLMDNGLLDELRLWIHPVVVGTGDPAELLTREGFAAKFDLTDTTVHTNGVIIATYTPKPS